jgi:hypothetical protein
VEGVSSKPLNSPVVGKAWIVGEVPKGAFADNAEAIAGWTEGGWRFIQASEGMRSFDRGIGVFRQYSDGWSIVGAPVLPVGGGTVDVQAPASLTALAAALEQIGIFSPR